MRTDAAVGLLKPCQNFENVTVLIGTRDVVLPDLNGAASTPTSILVSSSLKWLKEKNKKTKKTSVR